MLTPCPTCQTPIVTADSLAGVELTLQAPPRGWDGKTFGGFVIRGGVAQITTKYEPGESRYVAHRPLCKA